MFEWARRKAEVRKMTDERKEEQKEQADGMPEKEATEKLEKSDVDMVAGGQGKGGPIETPEIP